MNPLPKRKSTSDKVRRRLSRRASCIALRVRSFARVRQNPLRGAVAVTGFQFLHHIVEENEVRTGRRGMALTVASTSDPHPPALFGIFLVIHEVPQGGVFSFSQLLDLWFSMGSGQMLRAHRIETGPSEDGTRVRR